MILNLRLSKISAGLENLALGYSYDINFSSSNKYLNNTHEVSINMSLEKPKSIRKQRQKPVEISPYDL